MNSLPALSGNKSVKVISEKISTIHSSMTIEDSKVSRLFPISCMFRLGKIKNDRDSVFVILSDGALVCRGRVGSNGAMSIFGVFGGFKIADGHEHFGE